MIRDSAVYCSRVHTLYCFPICTVQHRILYLVNTLSWYCTSSLNLSHINIIPIYMIYARNIYFFFYLIWVSWSADLEKIQRIAASLHDYVNFILILASTDFALIRAWSQGIKLILYYRQYPGSKTLMSCLGAFCFPLLPQIRALIKTYTPAYKWPYLRLLISWTPQ